MCGDQNSCHSCVVVERLEGKQQCSRAPVGEHAEVQAQDAECGCHEQQEVNEKQPKPRNSPSHNHDSTAPRQHPLIYTGAGSIHPVHGPLLSPATEAIAPKGFTSLSTVMTYIQVLFLNSIEIQQTASLVAAMLSSSKYVSIFDTYFNYRFIVRNVLAELTVPEEIVLISSQARYTAKIYLNVSSTHNVISQEIVDHVHEQTSISLQISWSSVMKMDFYGHGNHSVPRLLLDADSSFTDLSEN